MYLITIKKSYSSLFYLRTGAKLAPSRDFSFFTVLILRPVNTIQLHLAIVL